MNEPLPVSYSQALDAILASTLRDPQEIADALMKVLDYAGNIEGRLNAIASKPPQIIREVAPVAPAPTPVPPIWIWNVSETIPDHGVSVILLDGRGKAAIGSFDKRDNLWNIDGRFFGFDAWPYWMTVFELPSEARG